MTTLKDLGGAARGTTAPKLTIAQMFETLLLRPAPVRFTTGTLIVSVTSVTREGVEPSAAPPFFFAIVGATPDLAPAVVFGGAALLTRPVGRIAAKRGRLSQESTRY